MIRGFFYKVNRSFKNLKNVIFHVKLLSPTLRYSTAFKKPTFLEQSLSVHCSVQKITPLRLLSRHRHQYQLIDLNFLNFKLRHNLTKNQVNNFQGVTWSLLSEALCFTTNLSLYLHRIFKFYFFLFPTFIFSFN